MTKGEFVDRYGGIYEHSSWVPAQVWERRLHGDQDSTAGLAQEMKDVVDAAGPERQLQLIRAHPDLAGKAAVQGGLTDESKAEQNSAGIDRCSRQEFDSFQRYNKAYKTRFQFPFVMAVKGSDRAKILGAFQQRLQNDYETEFSRALFEIHKIAQLRLEALSATAGPGSVPPPSSRGSVW